MALIGYDTGANDVGLNETNNLASSPDSFCDCARPLWLRWRKQRWEQRDHRHNARSDARSDARPLRDTYPNNDRQRYGIRPRRGNYLSSGRRRRRPVSSGVGTSGATTATVAGAFPFAIPQTALATDQIDVSLSGYIPVSIDRSLIGPGPAFGNIGLYSTPNVTAKPGFITGVFTMDSGGFMPGVFTGDVLATTYDRIAANTGANLVAISDPAWLTASDPTTNRVTMTATYAIPMLTEAQYTILTNAAKARG